MKKRFWEMHFEKYILRNTFWQIHSLFANSQQRVNIDFGLCSQHWRHWRFKAYWLLLMQYSSTNLTVWHHFCALTRLRHRFWENTLSRQAFLTSFVCWNFLRFQTTSWRDIAPSCFGLSHSLTDSQFRSDCVKEISENMCIAIWLWLESLSWSKVLLHSLLNSLEPLSKSKVPPT